MTRIAILISGEYRKFDVCRKTMTFLNDPNIDIYVSTWDKTIFSSKKINLLAEELVTADKILSDLNRNAIIQVDDHLTIIEKKYNSKMINRWLTGFELIKSSGIQYDYVLVMRPDIFFNENENTTLSEISKYIDAIGFAWATSVHLQKLPDVLFLSTFDNMKKLFDSLSIECWTEDKETDWHIWWFHFVNNMFPIKDATEISYFTFCRYWVNSIHNFYDAVEIHRDWRDLRLLRECEMWGDEFAKTAWPDHVLIEAKEKWNNGYYNKYRSSNI